LFAANVVSFADLVVLRHPLFAANVVSKSPCLQFYFSMFAVRYNYVDGKPHSVFTFDVGDREIKSLFAVANPAKLKQIQ
jgi:hypothetical protein